MVSQTEYSFSIILFMKKFTESKKHIALDKRGYRIYPKYSDPSTPYHTCSKI